MRIVRRLGARARTILPLSPRGALILVLAGGLLGLGVLRSDLAALFWGASFLLFILYAIVAGHLFRIAVARRGAADPGFLSLLLPAHAAVVGEEAEAVVSHRLPRGLPPGFVVHDETILAGDAARRISLRIPLPRREGTARVGFAAEHRGLYACDTTRIVWGDILGLTSHRFPLALRESFTVLPRLDAESASPRFPEEHDESNILSSRRRRSETLLETRKYYPGDDPRRLNWKVLAHTDELFLRIGEEVPSPEARLLFVIDATANPLVPARCAADYLDALVEACGSTMMGLLARGVQLMLSVPGRPVCRGFAPEDGEALRVELAGLRWTTAPWKPEAPRAVPHLVVFSSPGSPGLAAIVDAARARTWATSVILVALRRREGKRGGGLKRLLQVPAARARPGRPLTRREAARLDGARQRELASYDGFAREAPHAAEA
jgi:uncharacterized protein (DUF58 family)